MYTVILLKLLLSAALGIIIGIERELKQKPLGLKTCVVISISSCLLTIVSIESAQFYSTVSQNIRTDPMRLAAQIVSGIGFLGAGVILRKNNDMISGLTTAAIIWAASGIGISVGAGFYFEAALGAVLILLTVQILPFFLNFIGLKKLHSREIRVRVLLKECEKMMFIIEKIKEYDIKIKNVSIKDLPDSKLQMGLRLVVFENTNTLDIYHKIKNLDGVLGIEVDS
jgi:putative Mg2+ transporter-C (MgtC) family protein